MNFELSETQQDVQRAVRSLAGKFGDEYWRKCDESETFPWDFYNAFAEAGWIGIAIPEEYGGSGLGISEAAILLQEVAASGAAMNGCTPMHLSIFGVNVIAKHGSEELRQSLLPQVATGKLHVCFAVTEPDAGTDTSRIKTFARKTNDGYVINGRKVWITKALESQKMVLVTRTTPREECAKSTDGISLFLIDIDRSKIDIKPIPKMGRNAVKTNEVFIDDLHVPKSALIGEEGKGFRYLLDGLNPERILLAHESIGIGYVALKRAISYANERVIFDRPIGANQAIQHPLAMAHAQLQSAELLARKAAWLYDRGEPCGGEANMAKVLCADAAFFAADRAVQTHGGYGYAKEYDVERYFRESRLMRIAPISQEMALNYISQHVLGLPRSY
ncbi:acyl-CoA dehydrogenase family protein [Maricaulis salignorans]|uniref:Acyl-CoA dehydrogenase n=1 Tax=Maricaulis salignorans TaxID=144026 RepID=A0A1G9LSB8_9PROT|nr:acyl-CoA dehydrogenase family protein [Maricaulis salignorans]SDL64671.1 acyl-CoA dehydrogenase [Maricaulis salignorans]